MPSANNEFSDSVSIQSVVIEVSSSISKVEISSTVTDIDIYEHIDKPYLTAVLGFVDIEDVVGSLDITGGEKIHITLKSVRTNTTVPVSKTFHIDKVMTADKGTDIAEFFVLHLIEDIGYTAVLHNVNRAYSGKPKDIISTISKEYFDKSIKELNYSEAALLAALPKAPSKYNPYKYPEVAKFRRNLVLENLEENKFISKNELVKFKDTRLRLKRRKIEIVNEANSYTEEVRRSIKEKYGFKKLYSEGLSIRTPLNVKYQIQLIVQMSMVYLWIGIILMMV